jgi:hypothetical protein
MTEEFQDHSNSGQVVLSQERMAVMSLQVNNLKLMLFLKNGLK